ncbi:hypothetical protein MKX01_004754, partial [Papaver californicum]
AVSFPTKPEVVLQHNKEKSRPANLVKDPWIVHCCWNKKYHQVMLNTLNLGFVSGLIPRDKLMAFERVLFRATRGIVFIKQTMIEDPFTDPVSGKKISDLNFCDSNLSVEKNVFVVFYSGERAKAKIMKICDAFGATHYPFTEELGKQAKMITES